MRLTTLMLLALIPVNAMAGEAADPAGRRLSVKGVVQEGGEIPALDTVKVLPASPAAPVAGVHVELLTGWRPAARHAVGGPTRLVTHARSDSAGRFECETLDLRPGERVTMSLLADSHGSLSVAGFEKYFPADDVLLAVTLPRNGVGGSCGRPKPQRSSVSRR